MASRTLIENAAHVLTIDPSAGELRNVDLLVEDGRIAALGPRLGATADKVMDASHMIVMPGMVDTHRHTWQTLVRNVASDWTLAQYFSGIRAQLSVHYNADDMYLGNLVGALEALSGGVTTLWDWSHNNNTPDHPEAAVAGLREAGIRAVYAYGNSARQWFPISDMPTDFEDVRRVKLRHFNSQDQLLTMAFAARGPQFATMEQTIRDLREARALTLPITMHVGDGLYGMNGPLLAMAKHGLLRDDTTYVHCNTLQDAEYRLIADSGGSCSIAPEVELHMGHGPLATLKLLAAGVTPTISIDVTSSIGGDMFGAMRALLMGTRGRANEEAIGQRRLLERLPLSCGEVLEFATLAGARACGLASKVGSIEVGKQADLVLIDTDALNLFPVNNAINAVVEACHPGNVDTVMVAGKVVKEKGQMIGFDLRDLRRRIEAARDNLCVRAGVADTTRWVPRPYHE